MNPVDATIVALRSAKPARVETAEILVEAVQEFVRDDVCDAHLRLTGLSRQAFDEIEGVRVTPWMTRQEFRSPAGQLIGTIVYETDEAPA